MLANTSTKPRPRWGTSLRLALVATTCATWMVYGQMSDDRPYMRNVPLLFGVLLLMVVWYVLVGDTEERLNLKEDVADLTATVSRSRTRSQTLAPWLSTIRSATGTEDVLANNPEVMASPPTRLWSAKSSTTPTRRSWPTSDALTTAATSDTERRPLSALPSVLRSWTVQPCRASTRRTWRSKPGLTMLPSTQPSTPSFRVVKSPGRRHLEVVKTQGRPMIHLPRAYREELYLGPDTS